MKSYTIVGVISKVTHVPNAANYHRTVKQRISVVTRSGDIYSGVKPNGLIGATIGKIVQFLADIRETKKDGEWIFVRARDGYVL